MKKIALEHTVYPQLPDRMSEQEMIEWYTLEPAEISLIKRYNLKS